MSRRTLARKINHEFGSLIAATKPLSQIAWSRYDDALRILRQTIQWLRNTWTGNRKH